MAACLPVHFGVCAPLLRFLLGGPAKWKKGVLLVTKAYPQECEPSDSSGSWASSACSRFPASFA
eukprot:2223473-Pyramimonas_sp.AAC.1